MLQQLMEIVIITALREISVKGLEVLEECRWCKYLKADTELSPMAAGQGSVFTLILHQKHALGAWSGLAQIGEPN